jgi:hypothetical protein
MHMRKKNREDNLLEREEKKEKKLRKDIEEIRKKRQCF